MSRPTADELRRLAEEVGGILVTKHHTVATAESCTAGLVAATLTRVPGASDFFWGGAVVYTGDAKAELVGLDSGLLEKLGTVSAATAEALAAAIRSRSAATYGLAVVGWAGPSADPGGTVGRVFGAVADCDAVASRCWDFDGDRDEVRVAAVGAVLDLLRQRLTGSFDRSDQDDG